MDVADYLHEIDKKIKGIIHEEKKILDMDNIKEEFAEEEFLNDD